MTLDSVEFDEVRVISLPPPQTAAVNRLLREEGGWRLLETKVIERRLDLPEATHVDHLVVYVLGHLRQSVTADNVRDG